MSASPGFYCVSKAIFYSGIAGIIFLYFLYKFIVKYFEDKKLEKFANTPKDRVVLHIFPKVNFPSNIPTAQPWVQKIELFCKLAKIPYIIDTSVPFGPRGLTPGKSPWITLNGEHMGDSQLIIEFLQKKFNVPNLNGSYGPKDLAVARALRVMLEDRFFWALPMWRFIWDEGKSLFMRDFSCLNLPFFYPLWYFRRSLGKVLKNNTLGHGVGHHSKEDILVMMKGDLKCVSDVLGKSKYILGNEICVEDCAIFGAIAQPVYGMPESPYEKYINDELPNLKAYCERIRVEYFPEWKIPE